MSTDTEINRKNILAILEHGNVTRKLLKESQENVKNLENLVLQQTARIDLFQTQIQNIQMKMYSGGATA